MHFIKNILVCFFLTAQLAGFSDDTTTIVIVHVNDMHGKIDNLGKLSAYVKKIKTENENVFLISAGDMFTGNPIVDKYSDKGFPVIDLMNKMSFNAAVLGNHEFDYGQEILKKRIQQARFPIICSNIKSETSIIGKLKPYIVLKTKNDIKLLFLGLIQTNENNIPDTHPQKVKGIEFFSFLKDIDNYKSLKDSANILIALSHLGYENDLQLSRIFPALDIIIGGHSHTVLQNAPDIVGTPMIVQAGAYLEYIGKLTLKYYGGKIISRNDTLLKVSDLQENDVSIQKDIEKYNKDPELLKPLGTTNKSIKGVNNLGSLMTDAVTTMLHADISFQNNGGIRLDSISSGNISKKTLYNLDPFDNELVQFYLSTDEIKSLIKNAYLRKNIPDLQVSGITYCIVLNTDSTVKNILLRDYQGKPIIENKKYSVIMNSYISSTYKFDHVEIGKPINITSSENLIHYVKYKKILEYCNENRVSVIVDAQ